MTEQAGQERPWVDPGHVLPDEDWAKVVKRAKEIREETQADAEGGAAGPGGIVLDMTALGVRSRKYFPVSGIPTQLGVLHSAECPLKGGYAKSLSEWACGTIYPAPPIASWQRFVDPIHRVRLIPDELGAWHASEANVLSIGWEQAGYARYRRDEWLTPDGRTQMEMLALDMAEVAVRDGLEPRWLSDWEVRQVLDHGNRGIKGFCTHRQIDPETRTDPGDGYPYDLLMDRIRFYMGGGTVEEDDVALTPEEHNWLKYIASPEFKAHVFAGEAPVEVEARRKFHAEALNDTHVPWFGFNGEVPAEGRRTTTPATALGWADTIAAGTNGLIAGLTAKVDALIALVAAQEDGTAGATKEEILAQLDASIKETFGQYTPEFVKVGDNDGQV